MLGTISAEMEVKVAARKAWEIYGTLRLGDFFVENLSDILERIDVLEGNGGVGTVIKLIFRPGAANFSYFIEKFVVIDNKNRIKITDAVEGGYLEEGIDRYRIRFDIIEKDKEGSNKDSCITRATLEYETNDFEAAKIAVDSFRPYIIVMEAIADYLTKETTQES